MEQVKCFIPETLEEALRIRKETGATILAGGSDLMVANSMGAGVTPAFKGDVLIITNLKELKGIRALSDGSVEIGACTTSAEIARSPIAPELLKDAASRIGAIALRNSATIGGNISFGAGEQREYDEQYIRRMATIAGADGFIRSMPEGYDTIVGERGVGLSGGQKQRISLARALAVRPSVLILDDTTSAVDMETEKQIQHSLKELDFPCTKVIIAQRISTTRDADRIIVLQDGYIKETGTHEELLAKKGYYYELIKLQTGLDEL